MGLGVEILRVRERALAELIDAHDFYEYSQQLLRALHIQVKRKGFKITLRNQSTGSAVNQDQLIAQSRRYSAALATSTLQQFVSILEAFLTDLFRLWLKTFPQSMGESELKLVDILPLRDIASVIDFVVERRVRGLSYGRPDAWFSELRKLAKIAGPTDADELAFIEIKASRDVWVHNQGVANQLYVDKAGAAARGKAGDKLSVTDDYHHASWELICRLVQEISDQLVVKVGAS